MVFVLNASCKDCMSFNLWNGCSSGEVKNDNCGWLSSMIWRSAEEAASWLGGIFSVHCWIFREVYIDIFKVYVSLESSFKLCKMFQRLWCHNDHHHSCGSLFKKWLGIFYPLMIALPVWHSTVHESLFQPSHFFRTNYLPCMCFKCIRCYVSVIVFGNLLFSCCWNCWLV